MLIMSSLVAEHWPETYPNARARFRVRAKAAVDRAGRGQTDVFQVPSAQDSDLTVDTVFIPASESPKTLFLLTSGVHGPEAPAGSAIQSWFLKELWPRIDQRHVSLAMVHVFNPYGFKNLRRGTESNINLNRNFLSAPIEFQTPNPKYRLFRNAFESEQPISRSALSIAETALLLARWRIKEKVSPAALTQALAQGQFEFPKGIEYGGTEQEPQVRFFCEKLRGWVEGTERVVHFDLHTGLGDLRRLHLIPGDNPLSRDEGLMARLLRPKYESSLYAYTPGDTEGFYKTIGDINSLMPKLTQRPTLALTFEFGTLGSSALARIDGLERLRLENLGHHAGYRDELSRDAIRSRFSELFNPRAETWRENALRLAGQVLTNVTSRL